MPEPNETPSPAVPARQSRRRSLLYVPASSERMIRRAASRGADILVLDLEDAVHASRKEAARARLREARRALAAGGATVAARANPPASPEGRADLRAIAAAGFDAAVLPKTENPDEVGEARRQLGPATPIWLMIETARGGAGVFELAQEVGVRGLVFGSADYRLDLGARPRGGESDLDYIRQRLLLAARSAGVPAWDAPFFAFRDLEGLRRSARRAAELGFEGKAAVHPVQVPVIHQAFEATPEERRWAERVIRAIENAAGRGEAVAELDGELIERLHLRQAKRLLGD